MSNPFLAVTRLVSTVTDASACLFVPIFKSALQPVTPTNRIVQLYPLTEDGDSTRRNRKARFIYGRVRWSVPRMIIEWQTKGGPTKENFAIYRGRTIIWREARLLDLSIFTTGNPQTDMVTYRAVDTTAKPPGPYYYWIVNLTANYSEQRFGPYSAIIDEMSDS